MSRNMKDYLPSIYNKFLDLAKDKERSQLQSKCKSIKISPPHDVTEIKKFTNNIILKEEILSLPTGGVVLEMEIRSDSENNPKSRRYLILLGSRFDNLHIENNNDIFFYDEDISESEALFLILAHKYNKYLYISQPSEAIDFFLGITDCNFKEEISIREIKKYYDPIYALEININSPLYDKDTIDKVINLLIEYPSLLHKHDKYFLTYTQRILELDIDASTQEKFIDKYMIFDSLTAFYNKHRFLDIYRCLEKLFYFPQVYDLFQELNRKLQSTGLDLYNDLYDLSVICQQRLSWRYKEYLAIEKIIELALCKNNLNNYQNEINTIIRLEKDPDNIENTIPKISIFDIDDQFTSKTQLEQIKYLANKIYSYRNSLVHHKNSVYNNTIKLKENEWQSLANIILYILFSFCTKLSNKDFELSENI